jgi:hypothetical protein
VATKKTRDCTEILGQGPSKENTGMGVEFGCHKTSIVDLISGDCCYQIQDIYSNELAWMDSKIARIPDDRARLAAWQTPWLHIGGYQRGYVQFSCDGSKVAQHLDLEDLMPEDITKHPEDAFEREVDIEKHNWSDNGTDYESEDGIRVLKIIIIDYFVAIFIIEYDYSTNIYNRFRLQRL